MPYSKSEACDAGRVCLVPPPVIDISIFGASLWSDVVTVGQQHPFPRRSACVKYGSWHVLCQMFAVAFCTRPPADPSRHQTQSLPDGSDARSTSQAVQNAKETGSVTKRDKQMRFLPCRRRRAHASHEIATQEGGKEEGQDAHCD